MPLIAATANPLPRLVAACVAAALLLALTMGPVAFAGRLAVHVMGGAVDGATEPIDLPPMATQSVVYAADGSVLAVLHGGENRKPVPLDQIAPVLVNAGVTHPLEWWLDALAPGGRMVLPLTATMKAMGPTIGKGLLTLVTKRDDVSFDLRVVTFVAIYSAVGIRDEARGEELVKAMARMPFPPLKRLRRDQHEPADTCWLHAAGCCLSL